MANMTVAAMAFMTLSSRDVRSYQPAPHGDIKVPYASFLASRRRIACRRLAMKSQRADAGKTSGAMCRGMTDKTCGQFGPDRAAIIGSVLEENGRKSARLAAF